MICSRNVLEIIDKGLMDRFNAEKITLGTAICFDECWQKAKSLVSEKLFSDERNKFLWGLLREMKESGRSVDPLTLFMYTTDKYPQIQSISDLAAYICEVTIVVAYNGYDKVLSELLRFYSVEIKKNGWQK